MKRPIICIAAVGLTLCMIGSVQGIETVGLTSSVLSASAAEISDSGTCGESVTWTLDDAGTLTISGTGNMENYTTKGNSPFADSSVIKSIVIEDGITSIGNYAFINCTALVSVSIPDSVKNIGFWAFNGCTSLESVRIPESTTDIGSDAFSETPWLSQKQAGSPLVVVNGILA